jgi:hypothetical protein
MFTYLCSAFLAIFELLDIAMSIVYACFVPLLTNVVSDLLFDMSVITGHQHTVEYSYSDNERGRYTHLLCYYKVIHYS